MDGAVRVVILMLSLSLCVLQRHVLTGRERVRTVVVDGPSGRPDLPAVPLGAAGEVVASSPGGVALLERMTHDDIARGVWALADESAESEIGLSQAQASGLQQCAKDGQRLRVELESLRSHAATHRMQRLIIMGEVARLLGPDRIAALEEM